jgi:hypothetical protein
MRSVIDFERALLGILWLSWLVYWLAAAQRAAPNKRMETLLEGASDRIPLGIEILLMVFWWAPFVSADTGFMDAIPPRSRHRAGVHGRRIALRRMGPDASGKILERPHHSEREPSCDSDRTLRLGLASDL